MPEVAFVMSARQHYPLRELAATLGHELELQAVPSALHVGTFPDTRPNLVYILLDPSGYVALEGDQALPRRYRPPTDDLPVHRIWRRRRRR